MVNVFSESQEAAVTNPRKKKQNKTSRVTDANLFFLKYYQYFYHLSQYIQNLCTFEKEEN